MKRQRIFVIVHLHIPMIIAYSFPDAFYPKAVPAFVRFRGGKTLLRTRKGISPAGIYDGYYDQGRVGFPCGIDFDKGIGNAAGSFICIVQQIAEEGSKVVIRDIVNRSMPDVSVEGNTAAVTPAFIPAQNGIEHFMVTQAGGFFQVGGKHQLSDIGGDFIVFFLVTQYGNGLEVLFHIMD